MTRKGSSLLKYKLGASVMATQQKATGAPQLFMGMGRKAARISRDSRLPPQDGSFVDNYAVRPGDRLIYPVF